MSAMFNPTRLFRMTLIVATSLALAGCDVPLVPLI